DVRVDDVLGEVVAEVEHVEGDVELLGDAARVIDVGHRAAATVALTAPQLHGHAADVVAGFQQPRGRDRRVDSTGHRRHHLHGCSRSWCTAAGMTARATSTSASVDA